MRQKSHKTTPFLEEYDYVVAGAGSAGCVVAARLSEDSDLRVLLLEAGPEDDGWTIRMPGAPRVNFLGGHYNWAFHTEAEPHLGGRRLYQPRGRGLVMMLADKVSDLILGHDPLPPSNASWYVDADHAHRQR